MGILPIPVSGFEPAPDEEWRATLEHPVLAFVGRADDTRKNIGLLLDALPEIPNSRALLVGAAPAVVPDRVEATGPVPSVAVHLRRATLFVLPSWQEGFGIAAAEALASGLPVVTTPSGGPEALVRDSGGGVVLEGFSPGELAETVRGLLADPPASRRCAAAAGSTSSASTPRNASARYSPTRSGYPGEARTRGIKPREPSKYRAELGWAAAMRFLITTLQTYESEFYGVVGRELERRGHEVVHVTESRARRPGAARAAASTRAPSRT